MARARPVLACDAETDPFLHGRVPVPFIWGVYDGKKFITFNTTAEFVNYIKYKPCIVYAHNGGKFDYMFLLTHVTETKAQIINGRIVSMFIGRAELRDSYSIIPEALAKFGDKREIKYWKLEKHHRANHMPEIVEYLKYDCTILYDAVTRYRSIAGTQKTIASNALSFAKRLGIDPGKTNYRFDAKYRSFYFGGRCQCFLPGTHQNINLLDIHSAYPFAMLQEHATGSNFVRRKSLEGMTKEEIQRSFIVIECTSLGAFPIRTRDGLLFPHEYNEYHITGWEYLVAKEFGLVEDEKILEVRYTGDTINFIPYIRHWFEYKASWDKKSNPVEYTIGKIMQNSLYGKLAQDPARYYDYKIVQAGTAICHKPIAATDNKSLCAKCGEKMLNHGWLPHREFEGHEIHRRPSLWRYKIQYGIGWEARGLYNNVATGASITGFTRAHLLRAMCTIGRQNVIYCDTDGIICKGETDLSGLKFTAEIGDWEHEDRAPIGHFAGKKLYGIQLSERHNKDGKATYKLASKGSRLNEKHLTELIEGKETTHIIKDDALAYDKMIRLVNGETIIWENDAPTFSIDGSADFIHREIRATARIT
jgi:hypothetical protein